MIVYLSLGWLGVFFSDVNCIRSIRISSFWKRDKGNLHIVELGIIVKLIYVLIPICQWRAGGRINRASNSVIFDENFTFRRRPAEDTSMRQMIWGCFFRSHCKLRKFNRFPLATTVKLSWEDILGESFYLIIFSDFDVNCFINNVFRANFWRGPHETYLWNFWLHPE